jgi:MotA/TolQ/ExbB proton channel family
MKPANPVQQKAKRRSGSTMAALMLGLPLAAIFLGALNWGLIANDEVKRYLSHGVQKAIAVIFFCALGTLGVKLFASLRERWIFRVLPLPPWNGKPVGVPDAQPLLDGVRKVSTRLQNTYLFRRVEAILDFICQRGSAVELDDHVRTLSDNDAMSLEASYGLTRFITWAMPILGFLGTVLGITAAISGVDANSLENGGMSKVTGGLGEAFDSTALALGLTMVAMFLTYLVERMEQALLEHVDVYVDAHLAHRFIRLGADSEPFVAAVKQNAQVLIGATEHLVQRQAKIWADTLGELDRRTTESQAVQQQQLSAALETAMDLTLQSHARRLAEMEKQTLSQAGQLMEHLNGLASVVQTTCREQQTALAGVAGEIRAQTEALAQLQEQEKHLLHLQSALEQNLNVLAGAGNFEQAVHSLTAAIHLLTVRVPGRQASTGQGDAAPTALKLIAPTSAHPPGKVA